MANKMLMFRNNFAHCCIKYEKEKQEEESLTTLTWPLSSALMELAVQCRLPHGKINWSLLHNEIGQVGIGKWGKNCAHHFKPIKNTKQYKKWVLERRSRANGFREHLGAIPIPIGDCETVDIKAKQDDNLCAVPCLPEVTHAIKHDPGIGDVSTETFDSFFNDSRTEEVLEKLVSSPIKGQDLKDCSPIPCHYGDGDVKVKVTPPFKAFDSTSHRLASASMSANPLIPEQSELKGLQWREVESGFENLDHEDVSPVQISDLEKDVKEFLSDLIEEVCDIHDRKVLTNVVMRLVGDSSSHHFLYMPSNLDLDTRELEEAMRKLTLEVSGPGSANSSSAASAVYVFQHESSEASPDYTTEFNISINTVNGLIGGFDVVADDSQQDTDDSSKHRPNRKVTVSVAKVLDELDKYRAEDKILCGATPVSSVSCDTLPVIRNQESRDEGLGPEGTNILRVSMSSPSIMMKSSFQVKAIVCSEKPSYIIETRLDNSPDDTEETSVTVFVPDLNSSMDVNPPVSLDSIEVASSLSSSISSLINDVNDIYDYNADTEEDLDAKASGEGRRSTRGSTTNSKSSSCSDVVHRANSGFPLNKSVNETDLETIELGQGESRTQTRVLDPVKECISATSTTSTETCSGSTESSSQESLHSQTACHVS